MPQVELSALSGPELRRLLDTTRARGQAALTYQILQEMAARRDAPRPPARLSLLRRPAEPRVVGLRLDDPLERGDDAEAAPTAAEVSAPPPETAPTRASRRRKTPPEAPVESAPPPKPRSVWDSEPEPTAAALPHLTLDGARPSRRLGRGVAAGFVAGVALGVAGGWWGGGMLREAPPPSAPPPAEIQIADGEPPPAPAPQSPSEAGPAPQAPPDAAEYTPPTALAEASAASPDSEDLTQDAAARAAEPQPAPASAPADACTGQPTPADRVICADPQLQGLQRDLRHAYAQALEAHQERGLLRQRQLAWASARDDVSDPDRLAGLYEDRIRRLNAATAAARQSR